MLEPPGNEAMLDPALQQRRSRLLPILAVPLACLALVGVAPYLLDTYSVNVLTRSLLYACVALTVDLLWGYMGILTFGQSAFFCSRRLLGRAVFHPFGVRPRHRPDRACDRYIGRRRHGADCWMAGILHGVSELYASVITLVLPIVCTQLLYSGGAFTGSSSGLSGFESFDLSVEAWFWTAGTLLVALATASWVFVSSDAGRVLVAIRENEQRCQYLGLDTPRLKIILFVACAVVGAITGYVFACYSMVVAPELAGFVFGTELVIYAVLGGRATLIGPVLATIIVDYESAQLSGGLSVCLETDSRHRIRRGHRRISEGLAAIRRRSVAPWHGCLARIASAHRPADTPIIDVLDPAEATGVSAGSGSGAAS